MVKGNRRFIFPRFMPIVLLLSMLGCAPVISKQIREQVKPDITPEAVLSDPEHYKGEMIVISGIIIEAENTKEETLLKVLQRPAGSRGKPKDVDVSGGRFLAIVDHYLDPVLYSKDRAVTIGGEVQGTRILPLGEIQYTYPVVNVKEIYLWPVEKQYYSPSPSFHIGFGLGYFH